MVLMRWDVIFDSSYLIAGGQPGKQAQGQRRGEGAAG